MKIKITSNLKDITKQLNREIEKIVEEHQMTVNAQNQSFILDNESEELLKTILENDSDFPKVLQKMFFKEDGLSPIDFYEESKLRAIIKELIDNGLISLRWGDGLPIIGRIEQKGRSYFEMKEKYTQNFNNGGNMGFKYLDKESEKILKELLSNPEFYNCPCFIVPNHYPASVIENLINLGYLSSKKGVEYYTDGGYVCGARFSQAAKTYDEMKEQYEKSHTQISNYGTWNDLSNSTFNNSQVQIGNENANQNIQLTSELIEKSMNEILSKIEEYKELSEEQQEQLKDLVEDVKEKNTKNKPHLLKTALKGLWNFAKDTACGVLIGFLNHTLGLNG